MIRATADAWTVTQVTKIDRIETLILDIPSVRGHVLSMATMRTQWAVLVRVRFSDGSEGLGEGTVGGLSYGAESPESIRSAIDTYIAPAPPGRDADDVNGAIHATDRLVGGNRIAKAAVEIALWDGLGRRLGVPVAQLFGGAVHRRLPVAWTLASGNSDTDIAERHEMIAARRHNIFKLISASARSRRTRPMWRGSTRQRDGSRHAGNGRRRPSPAPLSRVVPIRSPEVRGTGSPACGRSGTPAR